MPKVAIPRSSLGWEPTWTWTAAAAAVPTTLVVVIAILVVRTRLGLRVRFGFAKCLQAFLEGFVQAVLLFDEFIAIVPLTPLV